jgi:hypothetical protein
VLDVPGVVSLEVDVARGLAVVEGEPATDEVVAAVSPG